MTQTEAINRLQEALEHLPKQSSLHAAIKIALYCLQDKVEGENDD